MIEFIMSHSHNRSNVRKCLLLLFFSLALVCILLSDCYSSNKKTGEYAVRSSESPYYKEFMTVAMRWEKAILNKDFDTLISLALPEQRFWLWKQLNDKSSELYRIIYYDQWNHQKGKRSVCEILGNAKKLEIVMVKCGGDYWESFGYTTAVYFFDKKKLSPTFPLATKNNKLLGKDIWLLWSIRDAGQWYINFNFLDEGEIGSKTTIDRKVVLGRKRGKGDRLLFKV